MPEEAIRLLTIEPKISAPKPKPISRIPEISPCLPGNHFVTAEITNDTQETVFGMEVVAALMDEEGNLLYVEHADFYDSTGINAGSTVTYRFALSDNWPEIWDKAGVAPAKVEVLAYTIQD